MPFAQVMLRPLDHAIDMEVLPTAKRAIGQPIEIGSVDLVEAAFDCGEEMETAATYALSDSLSDPLGSINLAREAVLRHVSGDDVASGAVVHAFDQGIAVASRMIQVRQSYIWMNADTVEEEDGVVALQPAVGGGRRALLYVGDDVVRVHADAERLAELPRLGQLGHRGRQPWHAPDHRTHAAGGKVVGDARGQ